MPAASASAAVPTPPLRRISPATFVLVVAAATAGAGIAALWLTSGNTLVQSPYHHDDFDLLATSVRALPPLIRPVSDFSAAALADLGAPVFYAVLLGLIVLYPPLSTLFVARFLGLAWSPAELAAASFVVGFASFSFEASPEAYRWTGFITNAMSTSIGMAAALVALRGAEPRVSPRLGAVALFAVAVFAKEDCGPFVVLVAAFTFARALRGGGRRAVRAAASLLAMLLATALAALAYGRLVVDSPFTGGVGVYEPSFGPLELARVAVEYLTITPGATVILAGYALAAVAVLVLRPELALRFLATGVLVLVLVAPYAPLARHVFPIYAHNWLPPLLAATVLGWTECARALASRARRAAFVAIGVAIAVVLLVVSKPGRDHAALEISARQANNRTILREIARQRDALARHGEVIVEGLDGLQTPWWFSRAEYVNREVGADVRWIFVAAPGSMVARAYHEYDRPVDNGAVVIVPPSCAAMLRGVPRLRFGSDLRSTLVEPEDADVAPAAGEIALGAVDAPAACDGWSEPEEGGDARLRWAAGPRALLAVALPRDRHASLRLRLRAAPDLRADPLWMALSIDGKRVRVARVTRGPVEVLVDVPGDAVRAPTSLVSFEFSDWRGRGESAPAGGRADAAGVEMIVVD